MEDDIDNKDEQPTEDTSKLTYGEKFCQEWMKKPYNNDRVGKVTVTVVFKSPLEESNPSLNIIGK